MATIRDVAKRAGVSVAAVSRAFNNYPDINADTKANILRIAEELRFYPSATARNLVTHRSNTIGVVYPSLDGTGLRHPFIGHLLNVFKDAIGEQGYDMMLLSNRRAPFDRWGILDRIKHRDLDGVLLIGTPEEAVDELMQIDIPMVGLDYVVTGPKVGSVTSDNRRAIQDLVHVLYHHGYRKFGFLHGPLKIPVAVERLQGFYSGLQEVGIAPCSEWIQNGLFTLEGGQAAMEKILSSKEWPDVVISSADVCAIGAMQIMHSRGIDIPDQISIVGFDDIEAASYIYPQLTTISQDKEQMGQLAAEVLFRLIRSKSDDLPLHYVVPTKLMVRQSTRPL